jgi:flagellar hook protein FlgE
MPAKWKKGFDPSVILKKFEEIRIAKEDTVSFAGFEYQHYITVLKSMIYIDNDIPLETAQGLIVNAFHNAAKNKELTSSRVLAEINKTINTHLALPNKKIRLVTTLNIHSNNILPRIQINDCYFSFYNHLPPKYSQARNEVIDSVSSWLIDKDDPFSCFVVAMVYARTENEAAIKILDALDLLRGIWNLHINKEIVISMGGRKKPINQVTTGALHTLHNDDGTKASTLYWYDPEPFKNHAKVDFSKNSYKTLTFTKTVRKKLTTSQYRTDIETAIIRYVRALDSQDYNASFLKLWAVLEYLTGTLRDNYDKTIKRTSFHHIESAYHKQVLEHLRQYRNHSVHTGSSQHDIDVHTYQLKGYVEQLLRFHLVNQFKFVDLAEAGRFMDLPPDINALKEKISFLKSGIKYIMDD